MRPKFGSSLLSLNHLLNIILSCVVCTNLVVEPFVCENVTEEVITVSLDSLPEPFTNDKLPNWVQKSSKCMDLLGCIERLPDLRVPQETFIMKTELKILTQNYEQVVPFIPRQNCLQDSPNECQIYPYNLSSLIASNFNPNLRTIIVIPGYMSNSFEKWLVEICDVWSKIENINCILVSWSGGNKGLYSFAAANTKIVSRQITVLLYYLAQLNNLDLSDDSFSEKIHLIGHSLGAHISGFVGQDFGGKVGRITGLDVAGPTFANFNRSYRLDSSDAKFVDAIHTNGGKLSLGQAYYGIEMPVGHLDYYANDGKHQPNCNFNSFGCSHVAACSLFLSFLKHELYMREKFQMLNLDYHDYHRLFAYKSKDYESFHNGSSLSENCPLTTLDDNDLKSEDIGRCLVPVDFITRFDKLKSELEQNYGIDFSPASEKFNRYYFYTSPKVPYLNHHNLIRIRVTKSPNLKSDKTLTEGCDIRLDIKMANGLNAEHEIRRYNLLDEDDHYEIIVPYLSPNIFSKYSLATLDANGFYVDEREKLQDILKKIFPTSIVINGIMVGTSKPTKGIIDTLLGFLNIAKDRAPTNDNITHYCSLNVETVAVQPMKKLHRKIIAKYSVGAQEKPEPDLMHLFNGDESSPLNIPVLPKGEQMGDFMNSEIFIDTVVIGPEEEKPEGEPIDEGQDIDRHSQEGMKIEQGISKPNTETSLISGSVWLRLTISIGILTLLFVALILYKMRLLQSEIVEDKSALIV